MIESKSGEVGSPSPMSSLQAHVGWGLQDSNSFGRFEILEFRPEDLKLSCRSHWTLPWGPPPGTAKERAKQLSLRNCEP